MKPAVSLVFLPALLGLLAACAPRDRVLLLPESGGTPSVVTVKTTQGQTQIDRPYTAVHVGSDGGLKPVAYTEKEVSDRYGSVLAKLPAAEKRYTLNFAPGGAELLPESAALLPEIIKDLMRRPGGDLIVVGHTDRVGPLQDNDRLSLVRAQAVVDLLKAQNVPANRMEAVGRGEREPLVPTDDEVAEPKNRRVEIRVR